MRLVRSFKTRVAGTALLTTMGALLVAFSLFMIRAWGEERDGMVQRGMTLGAVMASNAGSALLFNDVDRAQEVLTSSRRIPAIRGAALFDREGRLFALSGEVTASPEGGQTPTRRFHGRTLEIHVPVRADHQAVGELVLVRDLGPLYRTFSGYLLFAAIIFTAVSAAALSTANWLARRVIEPVERLSHAMRTVRESGDFAQPVEPAKDQELAQLAGEFNLLLDELAHNNAALVAARDDADTANRLKTAFLANMSHELRTPLNGVLGMAHLLEAGTLTPDQRRKVQVISESADSLLALLSDILDVAKIESGKLVLFPAPFALSELVEEVCGPARTRANAKGLRFELSVAPGADETWLGDRERVKQIFANLVSNAVKFTHEGEVVVEVSAEPGPPEVLRLQVRDTGVGIEPAKLPLLFEKFSQADDSATRKYGGSGLGLAICRELSQLMQGRIVVESDPGQGSLFLVELPLARAVSASEAPALEAAGPRVSARVLASIDDRHTATVVQALVEIAGGEVRFAPKGQALADALREAPADLVLLDGAEGAAHVRRLRRAEIAAGAPRARFFCLRTTRRLRPARRWTHAWSSRSRLTPSIPALARMTDGSREAKASAA
jgi:signal transduction histidine kinase/CheY-like chemotaxis protein